jgi:hypothetical protein
MGLSEMNDTFSIVAPVMPRRQVDPFGVKLAVWGIVMLLLATAFGSYVVHEERSADARRAALEATIRAQEEARANELAAQADAALSAADPVSGLPTTVAHLLDVQAQTSASDALGMARRALSAGGSLERADVADLARTRPSLTFVDGPSTTPTIVSVAATNAAWAAAVMGPSGTCFWVTLRPGADPRYGTGDTCTGRAALAADGWSW